MTDQETEIPSDIRELVEGRRRLKIVGWKKPDCGMSAACRATLIFEDGSRVFLKAATDTDTERWLRTEYDVISSRAHPCMPRIEEWVDGEGDFPLLLVEDLSEAYWPASHAGVAWRDGDFERLFRAIEELSKIKGLDRLDRLRDPEESVWRTILEEDRERFLELGLCSRQWLERHAQSLVREELNLTCKGEALLHGDIRSDNLCFKNGRVIFVDWSESMTGHARMNLLDILAPLHLEGGPEPFEIAPEAAPYAARSGARLAKRIFDESGRPEWFRRVLTKLLTIHLTWFARSLKIDQPDRIRWKEI